MQAKGRIFGRLCGLSNFILKNTITYIPSWKIGVADGHAQPPKHARVHVWFITSIMLSHLRLHSYWQLAFSKLPSQSPYSHKKDKFSAIYHPIVLSPPRMFCRIGITSYWKGCWDLPQVVRTFHPNLSPNCICPDISPVRTILAAIPTWLWPTCFQEPARQWRQSWYLWMYFSFCSGQLSTVFQRWPHPEEH